MSTTERQRDRIGVFDPHAPAALLSSLGRTSVIFAINPFYAAASPPLDQLAYTVVWIVVGLALAIVLFSRREL